MPGTPLTAIETDGKIFRRWVGPGGDSLGIGHGAIWLTDYHQGTIARLRMSEATRSSGNPLDPPQAVLAVPVGSQGDTTGR
jgi:hypothetical protein